jgi:putative hydrolase of the HAD superfamily
LDDVDNNQAELFERLWNHFARGESWTLYDDVLPVCQVLTQHRLMLGVASNFDDRLVSVCRHLLPPGLCENVYYSAQVGYPKPSPEFFEAVQQRCGLAGHEMLMVGDDVESDFHGARAAGWHALWLDRDRTANTDIDPRLAIHSLGDLLG